MSLNPFQDQQPHEETTLDQSYLASMKKLISTIRMIDFNQQFRHHWQRRCDTKPGLLKLGSPGFNVGNAPPSSVANHPDTVWKWTEMEQGETTKPFGMR